MRAINLAKVAAEAEIIRIQHQHMLKQQGIRAALGLVAILFALSVLVLTHVAGWQLTGKKINLRGSVQSPKRQSVQ
jgi:hypothetical protein